MRCEISVLPMQWQEGEGESEKESLRLSDHVLFSPSLRGRRERVGKSYLEGVLKEIHVGINPDIIKSPQQSSPFFPHASVCTHCS